MGNRINNKYDYRSGLLDSLNVQHNASDVRNEDEYRKKVLNGLGVEFTDDDINQKSRYRAKVVEGLASDVRNEDEYRKKVLNGLGVEFTDDDINQKSRYRAKVVEGLASSGGGGGSSDFSTAEVTIHGATGEEATVLLMPNIQDSDRRTGIEAIEVRASYTQKTYNVPLFKGHCLIKVNSGDVDGLTGNVTLDRGWLNVTGNCSLIGYYVLQY